jgi:anti-sigma factor RsiW
MSLSDQQMMDVMAYADGELEGADLERIMTLVESDAEAKELFASMRAIGDGVRGSFDVPKIDLGDVLMREIKPNDLDKARIRRTARTRMFVVATALTALAAGVLFYMRDRESQTTGQGTPSATSSQSVLALADEKGVVLDFVDTPTPVTVFYVPAESTTSGAEGKTSDTPQSVVVWVDEPAPPGTTP